MEGVFNQPEFTPCPACGVPLQIEVFPALFRPVRKSSLGEVVMVPGESACFYHENKKAVVVCEACGRFLCALCDCELHDQHFCPGCLEVGKKKRTVEQLETSRVLYDRQALLYSVVPLLITGVAAIYLAIRHRKTPGSLVAPRPWIMPVALVLGILQTAVLSGLVIYAFMK